MPPVDLGQSKWSSPDTVKGIGGPDGPAIGTRIDGAAVTTPLMVLREAPLQWNIDLMARYCTNEGVELAPHAKTTMSPQLVHRQLAAGAGAATVANTHQARTLAGFGVDRLLIANEVVDEGGLRWLADRAEAGGTPTVLCYVDSIDGVALLAEAIRTGQQSVLVEIGHDGGRAGCRQPAEALAVAHEVAKAPNLRLAGVACFEGLLGSVPRTDEGVAEVRRFLDDVRAVAERIANAELFDTEDEIVLTAGGSAYFDQVVEAFRGPLGTRETRTVLRSGCYVTHDHGVYDSLTPLKGHEGGFQPALRLLATVLSRPEHDLAIIDFGKRDAPYDAGLPVPLTVQSRSTGTEAPAVAMTVRAVNDQHAFLSLDPDGQDVVVGDRLEFGISHPCTTFDKWRVMPVVDDANRVVDVVHTYF